MYIPSQTRPCKVRTVFLCFGLLLRDISIVGGSYRNVVHVCWAVVLAPKPGANTQVSIQYLVAFTWPQLAAIN